MEHLISGVREALAKECWYAALALALAIPETCASIDCPGTGNSESRYAAWVDRYLGHAFRSAAPHSERFFTGRDLYQARCAFLHQGDFDFNRPGEPKFNGGVVDGLAVYVSEGDATVMRALVGTDRLKYSIELAELCEVICQGAEAWLVDVRRDPARAAMLNRLKRITRITSDYDYLPI